MAIINGTDLADSFSGTASGDTIYGFGNNDTLFGNAGDDFINGNLGDDLVDGEQGNDTVAGGKGNDFLFGEVGNDVLNGGEGNDDVSGEEGNDTVNGGKGDDILYGDAGNDTLSGDLGIDTLIGGDGNNTFIVSPGKGTDIITDFVTGFDMIQLNGGLTFANLRITQGVGNSTVNTLISTTSGEVLAVLDNVEASELTSGDFITGQATPPTPPINTESIPLFQKPFSGEFGSANYFDHDLPSVFKDSNNYMLTWQGDRIPIGSPHASIDGHIGYDWSLPEGTPLLAVADGEVSFAGESQSFFCPPLNRVTSGGLGINIKHTASNSERFESYYGHLSRIDVRQGQFVRAGQQIGLSGNTGCSGGPHLHFGVNRLTNTNNGQPVSIDPYGWSGNGIDPWSLQPDGAKSVYLWKEGQAPRLF